LVLLLSSFAVGAEPSPASAQGTAPRYVEFQASSDHNSTLADGRAVVSAYQIEFALEGAAAPFQLANIGKPVPASDGKILHDLSNTPVAWPVAGGTYTVRVTATGPTGEGRSAPSAPFVVGSDTGIYDVGPGQPLATLADVPWDTLAPGSLVRIQWRAEPYRHKWLIATSGTASAPIVIQGVPSATGDLPVVDGAGATTARSPAFAGEQLGVIAVAPATATAAPPAHVVIERLEIRGARPGNTFVASDGRATPYGAGAASIYVENGEDIIVRDCVLHDSAQGLVVASTGGGAARAVQVTGNYFYGNGTLGVTTDHNVSTEAIGVVFEANRFGPLQPGALGHGLSDRSAGTVVRANWIEGGDREVDLADARSAVVRVDPGYREAFVYGNVILEPAASDSPVIVGYGGDPGTSQPRQGVLHFYNNTVVSGRINGTTLLQLPTNAESADVRNNIVSTPGGELAIAHGAGVINVGRNWFTAGYQPTTGTFTGTLADGGLVVTGTTPGFVDASQQDFSLAAFSPAIDLASDLADAVPAEHRAMAQYVRHRRATPRAVLGRLDLGAFEAGTTAPSTQAASGRVVDNTGTPVAGVVVALSGAVSASTTTGTDGIYVLGGIPRGGTVSVTPSLANHTFSPAGRSFANVTNDVVADFVATALPNAAPAVALTAPAHGATYTAPASVTLNATASDADGTVARVAFYRDATLVSTDTSAPYQATLTGLTAGSYTLSAAAVDDRGATTTSPPVVITVAAPTSIALAPVADTYVRGGRSAGANYGTATPLYVQRSNRSDLIRQSFLIFDVSAVGPSQRALLRLSARLETASSKAIQIGAYAVANTGWSETGVTYSTRPAIGTRLATFAVASTTASQVDVDVTAYVQAERAAGRTRVAFGLLGASNTTTAVSFPSREAASDPPRLVVQ
jgi:hypothetical protein